VILRFSVRNYLSFDEEQEISFVASKLRDRDDGLIDLGHVSSGLKGLPVAAVYGANASGKSNLLRALFKMRDLVLFSHRSGGPGDGIKRKFYALRDDCEREETKFSIDFVMNNIRYHYGFSFNDELYQEEWLYSYPEGSRRLLFERTARKPIKFGSSFKGEKKVFESLMRDNSLFVSVAAQNNHDILGEVFKFFQDLVAELDVSGARGLHQIKRDRSEVDDRLLKFLALVGTGIVSYRKKKTVQSPESVRFREKFISLITEELNDGSEGEFSNVMRSSWEKEELEFGHQGERQGLIYFDISEESAGTQKIIGVLSQVFSVLDEGGFISVDEIDVSVHSQVTEAIFALFLNKVTNPNGAQLLATTHDTNLMSSKVLRRDEIWLVEKNQTGMSELFPLTDIRTRKQDNIEKGYLEGRYGAVPMVDIPDLVAEVGCGAEKS